MHLAVRSHSHAVGAAAAGMVQARHTETAVAAAARQGGLLAHSPADSRRLIDLDTLQRTSRPETAPLDGPTTDASYAPGAGAGDGAEHVG